MNHLQPALNYAVIMRRADGALEAAPLATTPRCAVQSVGIFEGRQVFGVAVVEPKPITGMQFVLREVGPDAKPEAIPALTSAPSPQAGKARGEVAGYLDDDFAASLDRNGSAVMWREGGMAKGKGVEVYTTPQPQGDASPEVSGGGEVEVGDLRNLLDEVRQCFTRDDDLPRDLLPRIDAALSNPQARPRDGYGACGDECSGDACRGVQDSPEPDPTANGGAGTGHG